MAKAKRETPCVICHKMIQVGEEIQKYHHGPAHESCIGNSYIEGDVHAYKRRGKRRPGGRFKM